VEEEHLDISDSLRQRSYEDKKMSLKEALNLIKLRTMYSSVYFTTLIFDFEVLTEKFSHVVAAIQMVRKGKCLKKGEKIDFIYVNAEHKNPFRREVSAEILCRWKGSRDDAHLYISLLELEKKAEAWRRLEEIRLKRKPG